MNTEKLVISLDPDMVEVMEKAMNGYTGDKSTNDYQEVMHDLQKAKEEQ